MVTLADGQQKKGASREIVLLLSSDSVMLALPHSVVDNSDNSPTRLTAW